MNAARILYSRRETRRAGHPAATAKAAPEAATAATAAHGAAAADTPQGPPTTRNQATEEKPKHAGACI